MTKELFETKVADAMKNRCDGYMIAQCSDKIYVVKNSEVFSEFDNLWNHGIDIRIFDKNSEMHIFRTSIGADFREYESDDSGEYIEERQYLDIDTKRSQKTEGNIAVATGGGTYSLPIKKYNDSRILIHNYIDYEDETGRAFIKNWRCVDIEEGK